MEGFLFWFLAFGLLSSAVAVIVNRSPVASALGLVTMILALAGLFGLLGAYFLAAVQVWVYAGAVMVLFLFIIMLLDLKAEEVTPLRPLGVGAGLLTIVLLGIGFWRAIPASAWETSGAGAGEASDAASIGHLLFSAYVLPFEGVGLLLLIAMIGVIVLSKSDV
ncbi:NADH-quinone oxidoreductase subunit J [Methylacidimicrobium cyclopophantes]|uniref:NADH-quinone oxidoreductase subunit J n=1 Tax=Methylacidimicrobium cyclopophantes TaxID=1041766 RepID=A0A5E6M6J5_9BACT|nr:NADH-quinone oxidoreductase subunit J [Methylacidimicrobium cyclopophantes]VVM05174.1 NADH-quinone oxidoreductase subunit J [Methylacidimicrobium cyclopophantes]